MKTTAFERFAGLCAILAGIAGFLYSLAFIVIARSAPNTGELLSAVCLTVGGLLSAAALSGLYGRVREVDGGFALLALLLGVTAAMGSALHGGYDLANTLNPPNVNAPSLANLPSQLDPRGLLTFGVAGLSLLIFGALINRGGQLPKGLGILAYILAALLIIVYLGRLIILDAASLIIVIPAALTGFVINPVWYIWLGVALRRKP
jgi:hypothetical protein